eukprot:2780431-Pleurochrysis_carterae.AAC.3
MYLPLWQCAEEYLLREIDPTVRLHGRAFNVVKGTPAPLLAVILYTADPVLPVIVVRSPATAATIASIIQSPRAPIVRMQSGISPSYGDDSN